MRGEYSKFVNYVQKWSRLRKNKEKTGNTQVLGNMQEYGNIDNRNNR